VFSRLKDSGLKVKFAKCVWAAAECRVLGSVVSEHGIKPDHDKVEVVHRLPVPRNVADLRSFLGAAGYFHEHLPNLAATTAPLRALLKKGVKFDWTHACHEAFEFIKAQLVSSNCLRMPQLDQPFILTTDWSKVLLLLF
jgi:capsular polysaccharide biosynthesis protein